MFPVGDTSKPDIRLEAEALDILVAKKPDSHDICFIPDGDTAGFLQSRLGAQPGEIVDAETGEVLGEHQGAHTFTIGQRKGLAVEKPAADGKPRYVTRIDVPTRRVHVGPAQLLEVNRIAGVKPTWTGKPAAAGESVGVQWRAHGTEVSAVLEVVTDSTIVIKTSDYLQGVAPGQQAVFYVGDRVIGSMTIDSAQRD
jgi:tRNA-specific 2-thiouridylase